jgi:hypothetical protein
MEDIVSQGRVQGGHEFEDGDRAVMSETVGPPEVSKRVAKVYPRRRGY